MKYLVSDLQKIGLAGGGFAVDSTNYLVSDLQRIASSVKTGGGRLDIHNAGRLLVSDLQKIALAGKGRVYFHLD